MLLKVTTSLDDALKAVVSGSGPDELLNDRLREIFYPHCEPQDFTLLALTESVDDAVLFLERKCPEWRLERMIHNQAGRWFVSLEHRTRRQWQQMATVSVEAQSLPRAIVAAVIKAVAQRSPGW